jgi:hypothetical protein
MARRTRRKMISLSEKQPEKLHQRPERPQLNRISREAKRRSKPTEIAIRVPLNDYHETYTAKLS